jgi:hypothetical protein
MKSLQIEKSFDLSFFSLTHSTHSLTLLSLSFRSSEIKKKERKKERKYIFSFSYFSSSKNYDNREKNK